MIFAAGLGTRLKPLTDIVPKALVPVCGKPLLQRVLERVDGSGNTIVINVHHHADQIVNYINTTKAHWQADIRISDESDMLLETGGGLKKAAKLFPGYTASDKTQLLPSHTASNEAQLLPGYTASNKAQLLPIHTASYKTTDASNAEAQPILIHNVDIISNVNLDDLYAKAADTDATLLVSERKTQRYLLFDNDMRLVGWTNIATGEVRSPYPNLCVADCKMYAFSGIHVISRSLISAMETWPEKFPIIDFYLNVCASHDIRGIVQTNLQLLDVGKLDTLDSASSFLASIKE